MSTGTAILVVGLTIVIVVGGLYGAALWLSKSVIDKAMKEMEDE